MKETAEVAEMLAVAWANGSVQALNPTTGDTFWIKNTAVQTWGITDRC